MRYAIPNDARGITKAEYDDLIAHGIKVGFVYENATLGMLNGTAQGVADAQTALSVLAAIGAPADAPLYWAADYDIPPGSPRVAPTEAYVDGWNTVIPAGRRGGYGGLWFLKYLHDNGKVELLWECGSTSFRHGVDPATVPLALQQTTLTPPVPGTDHNYIFDTAFASLGATPIVPTLGADMASLRIISSPSYRAAHQQVIHNGVAVNAITDNEAITLRQGGVDNHDYDTDSALITEVNLVYMLAGLEQTAAAQKTAALVSGIIKS
jgi:hypothetical protein